MDTHDPLHLDFDDIERRLQVLEREHRMRRLRCLRGEAPENRLTESSIILAVDVYITSALSMQIRTLQHPRNSWHYEVNVETL
jgi:hypothetical protein